MKNILLLVTAVLMGCSSPVAPNPAEDYSLVVFGETGVALEGTLGTQPTDHPIDGRTGTPRLPEELRLTEAQVEAIRALREAFRTTHEEQLTALREVFERARDARKAGATREEVRAILFEGREIAQSLREPVFNLHLAILAVMTPEQRNWIITNRPRNRRP